MKFTNWWLSVGMTGTFGLTTTGNLFFSNVLDFEVSFFFNLKVTEAKHSSEKIVSMTLLSIYEKILKLA